MNARKKLRYIKSTNLPPRINITAALVWWLVFDRLSAPPWLYGVVFTLIGIVYIAETVRFFSADAVDVVGNEGTTK